MGLGLVVVVGREGDPSWRAVRVLAVLAVVALLLRALGIGP